MFFAFWLSYLFLLKKIFGFLNKIRVIIFNNYYLFSLFFSLLNRLSEIGFIFSVKFCDCLSIISNCEIRSFCFFISFSFALFSICKLTNYFIILSIYILLIKIIIITSTSKELFLSCSTLYFKSISNLSLLNSSIFLFSSMVLFVFSILFYVNNIILII